MTLATRLRHAICRRFRTPHSLLSSMATDGESKLEVVPDVVAASRFVVDAIEAREQAEGVGARVWRSIGGSRLRNFDPFLMLDEFRVAKPAGFPDHPHRGFETVTLMLHGSFEHEDFCGHRGVIGPGDLQWMTAGRGIVHAEMPRSEGENHGLQLWVNLSPKDKLVEPAYQELKSDEIPKPTHDGVTVHVIAGKSMGVESPVRTRTPTMYLHFHMEAGKTVHQVVPASFNSFVYVLVGEATFGAGDKAKSSKAHHTLVLSREDGQDGLTITASPEGCEFVLLAGEPIGAPVVQHGPFVMNTREEIMEAMMDYQSGRNGFERAPRWESAIARV